MCPTRHACWVAWTARLSRACLWVHEQGYLVCTSVHACGAFLNAPQGACVGLSLAHEAILHACLGMQARLSHACLGPGHTHGAVSHEPGVWGETILCAPWGTCKVGPCAPRLARACLGARPLFCGTLLGHHIELLCPVQFLFRLSYFDFHCL